eukprot:gb/GECH01014891.1/.p1 GENE.gb/GECH01014891.1/~~gb/GECH01014891.1/.p1  ORF type:complete len:435 (+),score=99.56 gb/GECH01014891.1/:1-1305(+)
MALRTSVKQHTISNSRVHSFRSSFAKNNLFKELNRNNGVSWRRSYSSRPPLTQLSEEEQMLKDTVRRFAEEQIGPKVREMDEKSKLDPHVLKGLFEQGLMGVEIPAEYEGSELNFMSAVLAVEELARVDPATAVAMDVQNTLINRIIMDYGSETQKKRWLPRLSTDTFGSFCLSEWGSGSDAFALKTRAEKQGDDYIINGSKAWITNSLEASVFIVMANVNPEAGYKGITAFLVDKDNPGLEIGKKEDKLGIRASSTCEVILNDCKVSKDDVLGEIGKGYKIAISTLNEGRIGIAAQMVGLAQGVYDFTIPYLQQRSQFGSPIASFQGMQFQYAREAIEIQSARLLTYEAARLKEVGLPFVKEAALAKVKSSEVANQVAMRCIEWLGGVGFTKEFIAEKYYRDCVVGKIYEGTTNINLQTIAKFINDEYASQNK